MTRSQGMCLADRRPWDRRCVTGLPSSAPPCLWKYQKGMPFCIGTTTVSGPNSLGTSARHRLDLMRLHGEHHHVLRSRGRVIRRRVDARAPPSRCRRTSSARMPRVLQRLEGRATRDERHVLARVRELRSDESADRARPDDRYPHPRASPPLESGAQRVTAESLTAPRSTSIRSTTLVTPGTCWASCFAASEFLGRPDIAAEGHHATVGTHVDVARVQHLIGTQRALNAVRHIACRPAARPRSCGDPPCRRRRRTRSRPRRAALQYSIHDRVQDTHLMMFLGMFKSIPVVVDGNELDLVHDPPLARDPAGQSQYSEQIAAGRVTTPRL